MLVSSKQIISKQSVSQPLMSLTLQPRDADSIRQIRSELASFGLNPNDWQALQSPRALRHSRLVLVHREDQDLRISVNMHPISEAHSRTRIADVEMLLG